MSAPEPPPTGQRKPSRWSLVNVIGAGIVIIPGLCFGITVPAKMETATQVLLYTWILLLLAFIVVLIITTLVLIVKKLASLMNKHTSR